MIQSECPELEEWLRTKIDNLRKQDKISLDSFSEGDTLEVRNFLKDKSVRRPDLQERKLQLSEKCLMCSNMTEEDFQTFMKGESVIPHFELDIFNFYRLYYRCKENGNQHDQEAFLDYLQKKAEAIDYELGVVNTDWLSVEIRSLKKSLVRASAARKTVIKDIIQELEKLAETIH